MMDKQKRSIDLAQLTAYVFKRIWLVIICAMIGFGVMYWHASKNADTYTAYGTMFVTNNNPNLVNYGYTSSTDILSAVSLVSIYTEVIKSEIVMQRVLEYPLETIENNGLKQDILLFQKYPDITTAVIRDSIEIESVNETPIVKVSCTTKDPQMSADICNSILQVAPTTLKEVVGAGDVKPQDYAWASHLADARDDIKQGTIGGLAGAVIACVVLVIMFLANQKVDRPEELMNCYTPTILSYIPRKKKDNPDPGSFLLNGDSEMDVVEGYAKLRMNLLHMMSQMNNHVILITSSIFGEGKSTIAANLAISFSLSGKKVLLIDADLRRACLCDIFHYDPDVFGLSDILIGTIKADKVIQQSKWKNLYLIPAGSMQTYPSELLQSSTMHELLEKLEEEFDLILVDAPPISIVSDSLALSQEVRGTLIVVRQHYSDHREIRKALYAAEGAGMAVLGFVFYGENLYNFSDCVRRFFQGYKYFQPFDTRKKEE